MWTFVTGFFVAIGRFPAVEALWMATKPLALPPFLP
jgi:hypothetical protein